MAVDEQEQNRKLSEAEQRRLERFERVRADLIAQGYRCTELTVGIVSANVISLLVGIPIAALGFVLFMKVNAGRSMWELVDINGLVLLVALLVLTVVHEAIHGLVWSLFAENHFHDIEFGFMKEYLTPYCTCDCPLSRGHYILGALGPLVFLGLIPTIAAIFMGSMTLLEIGLIMILAAGGDVMIVAMLLLHGSSAGECLVHDHPTQAGSVVFER